MNKPPSQEIETMIPANALSSWLLRYRAGSPPDQEHVQPPGTPPRHSRSNPSPYEIQGEAATKVAPAPSGGAQLVMEILEQAYGIAILSTYDSDDQHNIEDSGEYRSLENHRQDLLKDDLSMLNRQLSPDFRKRRTTRKPKKKLESKPIPSSCIEGTRKTDGPTLGG